MKYGKFVFPTLSTNPKLKTEKPVRRE